jgi:hypothetical protein
MNYLQNDTLTNLFEKWLVGKISAHKMPLDEMPVGKMTR